ncbi:MAG: TIGR03915 family putative DNA repair protein [Sediminicola sp.]
MDNARTLIYDGSFNGFLTAVFEAFEGKLTVANIQKNSAYQRGLFSEPETIFTQMDKAQRVWNGIQKKSHEAIKNIYFAYQAESSGIEMLLYRYIRKLFTGHADVHLNQADDIVLKVGQWAKMVGREKHRMEAFVRFQMTQDGIYFASIEPDFNVLPLISKHFRHRYPAQQWIIYDTKRNYGLFHDMETVEMIGLDLKGLQGNSIHQSTIFTKEEHQYQELWSNYFRSTNIRSRINKKLHTQHVPKRYWGYLSEKRAV